MSVHWAFKHLGLAPTAGASEIRRAYARLLKAMDIDADVDGYTRLRNARDVALARASGAFAEYDEGSSDALDVAAPEPVADPPAAPVEIQPVETPDPVEPEPVNEIAAAQQRLIAILFPGGEQMYHLRPDEAAEAQRCFDILKTDPRLDQIDVLASAGDWFAQVVGQSIPRSDPLVRPVTAYFGWNRGEQVGVSPAVAAVIDRANALDWRDRLRQRSHRLHRAWKEMTKPADESSGRGWVSGKRIRELLNEVRTRHPSLEGDMDWYRVSLWENRGSSAGGSEAGWRYVVFAVILIIQIARFASSTNSTPTDPQATPVDSVFTAPSIDPETDITEALKGVTGGSVDAAQLRAENPKLYELVRSDWDELRPDQNGSYTFMRSERTLFADLVERGWASAPYDVLRHAMETDLKIARTLPTPDCASFLVGQLSADRLGEAQVNLRRAVDGELLLAADPAKVTGPPPAATFHYTIPGSVIRAAIKRSGLVESQFRAGIKYEPPPGVQSETQCRARLALREAILAQPKTSGLAIMRDMQT